MANLATDIALVRAFNRDYTRRIGALCEGYLDSPFSLTEARLIYEVAKHEGVTATDLIQQLSLDRGYVSRTLKNLETKGLLKRRASKSDGRRWHLQLTPAGKRAFAKLDSRSEQQVEGMLSGLSGNQRVVALNGIKALHSALSERPADETASQQSSNVILRRHQPGDMGWVIEQHASLYSKEYGWDASFEALVADIAAEFLRRFDPKRERAWIAERDGQRLGCVFLVAKNRSTARLRLLLVRPEARGLGLGRTLVSECVQFAREAGYRKVVLWTHQNLSAARHLYAEAGFTKTAAEPSRNFGKELISETWELSLSRHG